MLVLLPPSETKSLGGRRPPVNLDALAFPELRPQREALLAALADLAADLPAARAALGVSASKDEEILANLHLLAAPARPAAERYTGVLYDALDITSLPPKERARANRRILIASALFGVISATDRIPAYRLSAGSTLPELHGLAAFWRPSLTKALAALRGPILDLRSGVYRHLAPIAGAVTVQVLSERPDGTRQVVSHFNKATKGLVARAVAVADPVDTGGVIDVLTAAGLRAELSSPTQITVITAPQSPTPPSKPVV